MQNFLWFNRCAVLFGGFGFGPCPFLVLFFTVQHIVTRGFVFAGTHHGQFDLVLDVFDVDRAAIFHVSEQSEMHLFGQLLNGFSDAP